MQDKLRLQILQRLEADYGLKRGSPDASYLRGKCPACGKKELYTHHANPWMLRCGSLTAVCEFEAAGTGV